MKGRSSRYLISEESFSSIARRPPGSVVCLELNLAEEGALREVSKSVKSAFSREGRLCQVAAGCKTNAFTSRRAGAATHLYVTVL